MKTLSNLVLAGLISLGSLGLFNQANSQTKKIRVVDTVLYGIDSLKNKAGIPNLKVKWNNLEFKTNNEGYIDFVTSIENKKENRDFLNIYRNGNNVNFNFNGEGSLKIYDVLGREIFNKEANNEISWGLNNLANGFYCYVLKRNDKVEKGALIATFNNGQTNIYLKKSLNNENILNKNETSKNLSLSLEKIVESVNLKIKDEDVLSIDGKNNLGDYFDIEANYSSLDSIPDVIHMIPVLQFDSKMYRNILHFVKYMTFSDGTNGVNIMMRWYKKDQPIKIFRNATTAPNQNYVVAFDSAISSNTNNSWPVMTSFNYKEFNLPKMNLFQEVSTKPDTGSSMNYTSNLSHLVSYWYGPTAGLARGPPFYSTIYVNNTMENTEIWFFPISGETKHEIGHDLFSSPRHSLDKNHKMVGGGGGYISLDEGKSIRITYSLPDLQDMSIYKED